MKKSGKPPAQLVHGVRFRGVHQPFEARHVVKHLLKTIVLSVRLAVHGNFAAEDVEFLSVDGRVHRFCELSLPKKSVCAWTDRSRPQ